MKPRPRRSMLTVMSAGPGRRLRRNCEDTVRSGRGSIALSFGDGAGDGGDAVAAVDPDEGSPSGRSGSPPPPGRGYLLTAVWRSNSVTGSMAGTMVMRAASSGWGSGRAGRRAPVDEVGGGETRVTMRPPAAMSSHTWRKRSSTSSWTWRADDGDEEGDTERGAPTWRGRLAEAEPVALRSAGSAARRRSTAGGGRGPRRGRWRGARQVGAGVVGDDGGVGEQPQRASGVDEAARDEEEPLSPLGGDAPGDGRQHRHHQGPGATAKPDRRTDQPHTPVRNWMLPKNIAAKEMAKANGRGCRGGRLRVGTGRGRRGGWRCAGSGGRRRRGRRGHRRSWRRWRGRSSPTRSTAPRRGTRVQRPRRAARC